MWPQSLSVNHLLRGCQCFAFSNISSSPHGLSAVWQESQCWHRLPGPMGTAGTQRFIKQLMGGSLLLSSSQSLQGSSLRRWCLFPTSQNTNRKTGQTLGRPCKVRATTKMGAPANILTKIVGFLIFSFKPYKIPIYVNLSRSRIINVLRKYRNYYKPSKNSKTFSFLIIV